MRYSACTTGWAIASSVGARSVMSAVCTLLYGASSAGTVQTREDGVMTRDEMAKLEAAALKALRAELERRTKERDRARRLLSVAGHSVMCTIGRHEGEPCTCGVMDALADEHEAPDREP